MKGFICTGRPNSAREGGLSSSQLFLREHNYFPDCIMEKHLLARDFQRLQSDLHREKKKNLISFEHADENLR